MSDGSDTRPVVVVLGGPNGAGKTTCAKLLLPQGLQIRQFVNADTIAAGLSAFEPESVAREAGRIMLHRLRELAEQRETFAFETTMASRSFAPYLRRLKVSGYRIDLAYVWLRTADLAVERVLRRVARGGHFVPEETVRRRYARGIENFRELYCPLADSWLVCDNSGDRLQYLAIGAGQQPVWILDRDAYKDFERSPADV